MKKIIFSLFLTASSYSFSQFFEDGSYSLTDGGLYSLDIEICESGWKVCSFYFKHDENLITFSETGEWFKVNTNGVDKGYKGPLGWYQIETEEGTFEIEKTAENKYKVLNGDTKYIMHLVK